jgi:serine/threonine protein phosphatase 1
MTLLNFFKKKATSAKPASNRPCAPDIPVSVIGDVHGCLNLVQILYEKIDAADHIVFVGDFVDRGENTAGVLIWLHELQLKNPDRVTCLLGNHEVMMIEFLDDPANSGSRWLSHGGLQTLASFGVPGAREIMSPDELIAVSRLLKKAMPDGLEVWLRGLGTNWNSGNLWVVHAGADPETPMNNQSEKTFLWGSSAFLQTPRTDGIWVAHGHTVVDIPEQRDSRISTDTGAYHSGRLTAARCLPNGEVYFIQATH